MATFVLVHGAWHGGWCWSRVRRALADAGHDVFTPTLTGLGERNHLLRSEVDLETHVADVANLLRWEGLSDVVLCGHSYGGCVITGVADRATAQIAALVYLDAFLPGDGQSLLDLMEPELRQTQLDLAAQAGDGWRIPPVPAEVFNVNPADRAWVDRQCTPQPLATFTQPLRMHGPDSNALPAHYVYASGWAATTFDIFRDQARARGWPTSEIDCGHDVMLDRPADLTRLLISAAAA